MATKKKKKKKKKTPQRDPHLAHVVCRSRKCKAVYDVAPTLWTSDGGYYSSNRDFCKECGGSNIDVSYPWVARRTEQQLSQIRVRIGELSAPQMRAFIVSIYNVLWNPSDKEWSADTLDEIVGVFQAHHLIPNAEDANE